MKLDVQKYIYIYCVNYILNIETARDMQILYNCKQRLSLIEIINDYLIFYLWYFPIINIITILDYI